MKTAKVATALGPTQVPVWVWPRRPAGWAHLSLTVHPWALTRQAMTGGWSDAWSDRGQFTRELVAGLRQQDADRAWQGLHVQAAGAEPVLVSEPTRLGLIVRRAAAEWFEAAGHGTVAELPDEAPTLEEIVGFDAWAA